jgi:transcriptional regulator with XRE-family HTH domain
MNNNLNIGNKIAEYRREKGATQEHLADYVGVSVAAVSKWETNQSYPDITLLPSIADFFEVTIDGLLDYMMTDKQKKYKQIRDSIQEPMLNSDYNTVLPITLAALKKYPNDFALLEITARMLGNRAWTSETKEQDFKDAIYYYERAIKCAENTDWKYRIVWLKKDIAVMYENLGDIETALKKLYEINESGAFQIEIAHLKYKKGEKKEAAQLLQSQLWNMAFGFWMVAGKLANYYEEEGNLEMALESQKLHAKFLSSFVHDTPSYADEICCWSYLEVAKYCKKIEQYDEMWENLEKSVYHAVRFNKNPSYQMTSIKFMDALDTGINRISNSNSNLPCHGLLRDIKNDFREFAADERHIAFCNDLESAKKTKIEAGVWTE